MAEDLRIWYQPPRMDVAEDMGDEDEESGDVGPEVKAFWTLYIDVVFISLDGNTFDAAWAAILCALRDVRLPHAFWDVDREMILCSDELAKSKRLNLQGLPIASTYTVFRAKEQAQARGGKDVEYWILADPDTFEESLCDEVVTVTVDCSQGKSRILGISKSGGMVVEKEEMRDIVALAERRWTEWHRVLSSTNQP